MTNALDFSGLQILAVPLLEPERLFGKPELIHERFKVLAQKWHPDHVGGSDDVFKHILLLRDQANNLVKIGQWHIPNELSFTSNGKSYVLRYFKSFNFELGITLLSEHHVTYVIKKEFADLAKNAVSVINDLRFPDAKAKEVMSKYLPVVKNVYETSDSTIIMIDKPADLISMRDLREHCSSKINPTHVAWMISRMLNHASYFEWANISHNDLSMDTLFVCPEHHTVCVLGGWWYSIPVGSKLVALPQRTINNIPSDVLKAKLASTRTDHELIRLTGRELLGNANGIHLANDKTIPRPMVDWLRLPGSNNAVKDYAKWREHILPDSFGPRKFVKMPISASDVYSLK